MSCLWGLEEERTKALRYSFCLRTLVEWCSSFHKLVCPVGMVLALSNKHFIIPLLTWGGWWEWKSRYRSVCIGLRYTCHFCKEKPAFFTHWNKRTPTFFITAPAEKPSLQTACHCRRRVHTVSILPYVRLHLAP